ncbi:MAG: serine/threonine protein phosphatase [Deltaproteobacteria bacterium]|nr:serine/threonine protein phosphatase [Deltaproteobacteria bacterium]
MTGAGAHAGFRWSLTSAPARGAGEDRAAVFAVPDGLVVALADGAGGTSSGATAADAVIAAVAEVAEGMRGGVAAAWMRLLTRLDRAPAALGHGQCTAVVAHVTRYGVVGASVGDSGAWIVRADAIDELTADQARKPLLGSGARVAPLGRGAILAGTLVVASDGLFAYAPRDAIAAIARGPDLAAIGPALVARVRLPSGAMPDDAAIIVVRADG